MAPTSQPILVDTSNQELNALEMRKIFSNLRSEDKSVKAVLQRVVTPDCKVQLVNMIIKADELDLKKNWSIDYPSMFLTEKSVRNLKCRGYLLMLLDYLLHLEFEEAGDLLDHLLQYCTIYAKEEDVDSRETEELIQLVELEWTRKLVDVFHNLQNKQTRTIVLPRLKHYLALYNKDRNFIYHFGNPHIKRSLELYAEKRLGEKGDSKTAGSVRPTEQLHSLQEKTSKILEATKKRKDSEHFKRLKEQERMADEQSLHDQPTFSSNDANVPQSDEEPSFTSVAPRKRNVINSSSDDEGTQETRTLAKTTYTPTKGSEESLVIKVPGGKPIIIPLKDGEIIVEHRLENLPDLDYKTPKKGETRGQGLWDDVTKLYLLVKFAVNCKTPFYATRTKGDNTKNAKRTIELNAKEDVNHLTGWQICIFWGIIWSNSNFLGKINVSARGFFF